MIEVNNRIVVSAVEGHKPHYRCNSNVAEILDSNHFLIYIPQIRRVQIRFPIGSEHLFTVYTDGGLYCGSGTVSGYVTQNNVVLMKIQVDKFEHVQRRNFFRVDICRHFSFTLHQPQTDTASEESKISYIGLIKNISGSGLCFTTKQELSKNQAILCLLPPDILSSAVHGRVVSVVHCTDSQNFPENIFMVRLAFERLSVQQQDLIVKYVFMVERENILKKKNLPDV